jgi:hypothetical protein
MGTPCVWSARVIGGSPTPARSQGGRPTRRLAWGATRHCQLIACRHESLAGGCTTARVMALGGGGKARDVLPGVESVPHLLTVCRGGEETSGPEVLCDGTIGGEEALGLPWGLEPWQAPFTLARGLVGVFRPMVQVPVLPVLDPREPLPLRGPIAFQPIGDDDSRDVLTPFEPLPKELRGSCLVAAALHENIEPIPVLIHRPPQVMSLAVDREENVETEIQPDRVTDNLGREAVVLIAVRCGWSIHAASMPHWANRVIISFPLVGS